MPTYEYECRRCGKSHEIFHGIKEPPRHRCPSCGGRMTRVISGGTGVIFKGSGWYITDSRKGTKKEKKEAKAQAESKKKETSDS